MVTNLNDAIQVASGSAGLAGLAFAGQADARSGVHAGGNVDLQAALRLDPTAAATGGARVGDDHSPAAAAVACLLNAEETLADNHDAMSLTSPARHGLRTFTAAAPRTLRANLMS